MLPKIFDTLNVLTCNKGIRIYDNVMLWSYEHKFSIAERTTLATSHGSRKRPSHLPDTVTALKSFCSEFSAPLYLFSDY